MKTRTQTPAKSNKYYLKKGYGGYNPCILGNVKHRYCKGSVLVNCTGWATARFNEIIGAKSCKYLGNTNAEKYYALAKRQGLEVGQTPRPGAVMCWEGVGSKAGHVAVVESTNGVDAVKTSESGWGYTNLYWRSVTRVFADGNWGQGEEYVFQGFVYNPQINPYSTPKGITAIRYADKGDAVRWLQWAIKKAGYSVAIDGKFGKDTQSKLKKAQGKWGLSKDGIAGPKTQAKIRELYTLEG